MTFWSCSIKNNKTNSSYYRKIAYKEVMRWSNIYISWTSTACDVLVRCSEKELWFSACLEVSFSFFFATTGMNGLKLYNVSEWCTIMYNLYNSVQSAQHKPLKLRKPLNIKLPRTDRQTESKACVRHDKLSNMFPKNMNDHFMNKRVKEV